MESKVPQCAKCPVRRCMTRDKEAKLPGFCPTRNYPDLVKESIEKHKLPENMVINRTWKQMVDKFLVNAKGRDSWSWTRVDEIMEYARIRGMKKLGIATCVALRLEARLLSDILEERGFEVASAVCICGEVNPSDVGIEGDIFCNPIMQALVLNRENTELNIMVGLCVGHDILFQKYSKAETTTLVVKDHALGHNPIVALYLSQDPHYKVRFSEANK